MCDGLRDQPGHLIAAAAAVDVDLQSVCCEVTLRMSHATPGRDARKLRDALHLLGEEWAPDILIELAGGALHFSELRDVLQDKAEADGWSRRYHVHLHDGVLSRTLRSLEERELLTHRRGSSFPFRATYQVTPVAVELLAAAKPLVSWAEEHAELIERIRRRRRPDNE